MSLFKKLFNLILPEEKFEAIVQHEKNMQIAADFFYQGNANFKLNKYDDALYEFTRAIEFNPNFAGAYINRGNVNFFMSNYENASKDYSEAIKLKIKDAGVYYNRGCAYDIQGKTELAILDFTKSIRLNNKKEAFYNARGICYAKNKDYKKSVLDFTKAIKLNDKNELFYFNRLKSYMLDGKFDSALEDGKMIVKLMPDSIGGYINVGEINIYKKDYAAAVKSFKSAFDLEPEKEILCISLAYALYLNEQFDEALRYANMAIERNKEYGDAFYLRAMLNKKLGRDIDLKADLFLAEKYGFSSRFRIFDSQS